MKGRICIKKVPEAGTLKINRCTGHFFPFNPCAPCAIKITQ